MSKIKSIKARKILDSRSEWTVEVELAFATGEIGVASVPQGKSRGKNEAFCISAEKAVEVVEKELPHLLLDVEFADQKTFDDELLELDGTPNKSRLGGNTMLALSIAFARAKAKASQVSLWKYIENISGLKSSAPRLFVNVINGGLHAGNNLDFQEYIIIPKTNSIEEASRVAVGVYQELKKQLVARFGSTASNIGDEGGFAPNFENNLEPYSLIQMSADKAGFLSQIDLGMDAAAGTTSLNHEQLHSFYKDFIDQYNPIYIEDPFAEENENDFIEFNAEFGNSVWVSGDDITVTDCARIKALGEKKAIGAVIIKPNQIGTVSEAIEAVKEARAQGIKVVASHRSGETNDDFIADFAYGVGADGIKLGAPARGERVAKYNRLLSIEREFSILG